MVAGFESMVFGVSWFEGVGSLAVEGPVSLGRSGLELGLKGF